MGDKITIIRGDDSTIMLSLVDEDGVATNLTDATIYFTVKKRLEDTTAILTKEITDHDDPLEGLTSIPLSNAETELEPGSYVWDVQIVVDGVTISTNYGIFKVVPDITTPDIAS